jgi:site-specific DNA-methyltransferase (adenine-specific)
VIEPYWESEDKRYCIFLGDCLAVMGAMETGSVDAVITDPPYGIGKAEWDKWDADLLTNAKQECLRVSVGPTLMFGAMPKLLDLLLLLTPERLAFQCKDYIQLRPIPMQYATDPILVWFKKREVNYRLRDWFCITTADTSKKFHSTHATPAKHPRGMLYLVRNFSVPNDTVLDPFMGSGTTGQVCIEAGRRFIGIEISEEYCQIAVRRLKAALAQPRLLLDEPAPAYPRQESLAL